MHFRAFFALLLFCSSFTLFGQEEPDKTIPGVGGGTTYLAPFQDDSILFVEVLVQQPPSVSYYYKKSGGNFIAITDDTYDLALPLNQRGGVYNDAGFLGVQFFDANHYGLYQYDYASMTAELVLDKRDEELFIIAHPTEWNGSYIFLGAIYEIESSGNLVQNKHIFKFDPSTKELTNLSDGVHNSKNATGSFDNRLLESSGFYKTSDRLFYSDGSKLWEVGENTVTKMPDTGCEDCFNFDNWVASVQDNGEEYIYLRGHYDEDFTASQGTYLWKDGEFTRLGEFQGLYTQASLAPFSKQVFFDNFLFVISDNFGLVKISPTATELIDWPVNRFGNEAKLLKVAAAREDFVLFLGDDSQLWKFDGTSFEEIQIYTDGVFSYEGRLFSGGEISTVETPGDLPEYVYGIYEIEDNVPVLIWEGKFEFSASPTGLKVFEDIFYFTLSRNISVNHYSLPFTGVDNEPTPNQAPRFDPDEQTVEIKEDYAAGETIIEISATDHDNDELEFSIVSGNDDELFELGSSTGVLTATESILINTELPVTYELTIEVSDGELSDQLALTVVFGDENGEPTGNTSLQVSFLKDIIPGGTSSSPEQFTSIGDTIYFIARGGESNANKILYKTDGSEENTHPVSETSSFLFPEHNLFNISGSLYFVGKESPSGPSSLIKYSPEGEETFTLVDSDPTNITVFEAFDKWLFYAKDNIDDDWATDGELIEAFPRDFIRGAVFGSNLIVPIQGELNEERLFSIDANLNRTMLYDYSSIEDYGFSTTFRETTGQTNDYFFFSINRRLPENSTNNEFWITDGTPEGTEMFMNHETVIDGSTGFEDFYGQISLGDQLLFRTNVSQLNGNTWLVTDGTIANTVFIPDFGFNPDMPDGVYYNEKYYCYATGPDENSPGLYAFDPGNNSFEHVLASDYHLENFQLFRDQFVFSNHIGAVYVSNGVTAGTTIIPYKEEPYNNVGFEQIYVHSDSLIVLEGGSGNGDEALGREFWKVAFSESNSENSAPLIANQEFFVENIEANEVVGLVVAEDPDGDELIYTILDGNTGEAFSVGSQTGEILVADEAAANDPENFPFELSMEVSDGLLSTTALVTINLGTTPSGGLSFEDQTFEIEENSEKGTEVGIIEADAPEGSVLSFEIASGNDDKVFDLVKESGRLTVFKPEALDFETTPSFELEIKVSDGENEVTATVTVDLIDIEESTLTAIGDNQIQGFMVYPNPSLNRKIVVSLDSSPKKGSYLHLLGLKGRVYSFQPILGKNTLVNLPEQAGVYILRITVGDKATTHRVVVK
ncbi:MAG: cadherin domain-containing protein [Imperialibacter sp.]|uniref:cadherin domain-containing protein n=1 Tax=Imperialibacter sp. TaxID=2038411 RepID=UPI0032EC3532